MENPNFPNRATSPLTQLTGSVAETEAFAAKLALSVNPGWVIGLHGELGAGKTAFVRGFARGLGFSGRVHSPTFALMNEYSGGRWPIHHLDLYRLRSRADVEAAGLEEHLVRPLGITLVEWPERWTVVDVRLPRWHRVWMRWVSENEREIHVDWEL